MEVSQLGFIHGQLKEMKTISYNIGHAAC
jgi:hypothetical protein